MFELHFNQVYRQNQKQDQWQLAVHQAYASFSQKYPQWSNALFDQHFLTNWQSTSFPTATKMAAAWDEQLGPATPVIRQRRIAELTPAATDFLNWLEAALQPAPQAQTTVAPQSA
ncbi:MAG TPA: hypothetical protein VF177_21530 [Anaerolineae bacterium]